MLEHTFCHIPKVGTRTERALWEAGVLSWEDVLRGHVAGVSARRGDIIRAHVEESAEALEGGDIRYFYERLSAREHWRLFADFRSMVAYLDIETTGLGGAGDYVTTVGIYDGERLSHYVRGRNLDEFAGDAAQYGLLITYNGKRFDLPFIRDFLGVDLRQPHIDLMFLLRGLGYRGGLKGCERQLGIERGDVEGIDGFFAVLLWHEYHRRGNPAGLETLLAYNSVDVVNLEILMVLAYNMKLQETPFAETHTLKLPKRFEIPYRVDAVLVHKLIERHGGGWGL